MTKEVLKQALEALKDLTCIERTYIDVEKGELAIEALEEALKQEQDEPVAWMTINEYGEEDDIHYENAEGHLMEGWTYKPLYTTPQLAYMRMPKVGDRVVCIEDEDFGIVQSLTAGGSPEIKFDDGSHGTYLLREFAELFRYADTTPQTKEWVSLTEEELIVIKGKTCPEIDWSARHGVPLNNGEQNAWLFTWFMAFAKETEAKLKEKNK